MISHFFTAPSITPLSPALPPFLYILQNAALPDFILPDTNQ